jgi:hypothetical protein
MTRCLNILSALFCVVVVMGCASSRVDWPARVGNYTYDQAVNELGPPDKQTTLSDDSVVADWITSRSGSGFGVGTGMYSGGVGVGVGHSVGSGHDNVLRLTFKNGVLDAWSKH